MKRTYFYYPKSRLECFYDQDGEYIGYRTQVYYGKNYITYCLR